MKPSPFAYVNAGSLDQVCDLLRQHGGDARILAGGQSLIPILKLRLAQPAHLVDLGRIAGLNHITQQDGVIRIGAMTTHAAVAASDVVSSKIPALADLAGNIVDPQVRNRGTLGGSIANNDPAADYPAACLGLNATVVTNQREISADDFFTDMFETALQCEALGVKTVALTSDTASDRRAESALLINTKEVNAIVSHSEGSDVRFQLPRVERIIAGNSEVADILSGLSELTPAALCGIANNQGATRLQPSIN